MPTIKINERTYDLLSLDKLSFADQRALKTLTGGMTLRAIQEGLQDGDADATYGIVMLSVQKANPKFTEAELDDVNMVEMLANIDREDIIGEGDALPPTVDAPTASSTPSSGPETLGAPGIPSSPGGSE